MRRFSRSSAFWVTIGFFSVAICQAQQARSIPYPNPFQHVVVIFQENRTPDNLFQGLCSPPFGHRHSCSTTPNSHQYDIQTSPWLDKNSNTGFTDPQPVPLGNTYDLSHAHMAFLRMYDSGLMDGAGNIACSGSCLTQPQFRFVDNSTGILNPYLELAKQYGWANYMFQTNQGPSFPAHQFLFGGTSAPSAADDAAATFAAENPDEPAGCLDEFNFVQLVTPTGENQRISPCFEHDTLADLLNSSGVSWKYYAPSAGSIWTAPNAIRHICVPMPHAPFGNACTGSDWVSNVDLTPANVLKDIANCNLPQVSWVIPIGQNSDHAGNPNTVGGPSWVASIVNAIGTDNTCEGGQGYWSDTAMVITWDDWGGWYDHETPPILDGDQGDYQYGFRVPLIVVSAFTPKRYINNDRPHDFGSILRFIEGVFNIGEGSLGFADARAADDLAGFFRFQRKARSYRPIATPLDANFFLNDVRKPDPPDND